MTENIKKVGMERLIAFHTSFGWCGVVSGECGVKRIQFGYKSSYAVRKSIERLFPFVKEKEDDLLKMVKEMIAGFFDGKVVSLDFPIELSTATLFQKKVWEMTRSIPYGKVKTYGWLSQRLSKPGASRAVGNALADNPLPLIIPCHRVVRADGKPGGFSLPEGTNLKRRLIELEKGKIRSDKI